ncbi:hypothetical protein HT574_18410 [Parageobacillus sp. VR-IP]|uniref:hypothetical protein n=1 Tax=Anoxybacillaceae TaxID=3120669 RepID=UPI0009ECD1CB|nr:hypothetical protein [Parageobacillus sp. VR-IP]
MEFASYLSVEYHQRHRLHLIIGRIHYYDQLINKILGLRKKKLETSIIFLFQV